MGQQMNNGTAKFNFVASPTFQTVSQRPDFRWYGRQTRFTKLTQAELDLTENLLNMVYTGLSTGKSPDIVNNFQHL